MANATYEEDVVNNAVRSEISNNIVNLKANVCPMTIRLAWHASGTYNKDDTSEKKGGSDGATMRFEPEMTDGANAGLDIMMKILKPVKKRFPSMSYADLWVVAGCQAIKLMGGPDVPVKYGRTDMESNSACPMNGRLPDACLGSEHLREVFYRMGFDDKDIVALSGAHTVGSCHENRSGFSGPWTSNPLAFDNSYFKNLLEITWTKKQWDGPEQFSDPSGNLMMLPTDIALTTDENFMTHVRAYAADQDLFFKDFSTAFAKLIALGCPEHCQPNAIRAYSSGAEPQEDKKFRDLAMHGLLSRMKEIEGTPNPNSKEEFTLRTPLHKAAFFGHDSVVTYLLELGAEKNSQDHDGDTPLHDAAKMGHLEVVTCLVEAGAVIGVKNLAKKSAADLAADVGNDEVVQYLRTKVPVEGDEPEGCCSIF